MKAEVLQRSLTRELAPSQIITHPLELSAYEVDAGQDRGIPDGVVLPESADEVRRVVRWAAQTGLPLVARGAGTGLSGGAVAERGGLIVEFARMARVVELDAGGRRAVVEPGVVNAELNDLAKTQSLYFPPDPASGRVATLGGNVAENAGGPHCFKYGVTTNYVTGLEIVLADGQLICLGGSALDYPEYDFVAAVTGSEGTLALVTQVTVRLLRAPPAVKTMMAVFDSPEAAGAAVSAVIAEGLVPATLEMMDQKICRIVEAYTHSGLPTDAGAVLIIEVDGYAQSLDEQMDQIAAILTQKRGRDLRLARNVEERDKIWQARKSSGGAMARLSPANLQLDGTVPRSRLAEILEVCNRLCEARDLQVGFVLHAGDGNIHPSIVMQPDNPAQMERVHEAAHEFMRALVELGGSITGEHGVGIEKRTYMPLMYSVQEMQAMLDLKAIFDPADRLNPGKIFPDSVRVAGAPSSAPSPPGPSSVHFSPTSTEELSAALRDCAAAKESVRLRGGGTKSTLQPRADREVALGGLCGIRRYAPDDLYVSVGAGTRLADLQAELAHHKVWVPLCSPWPEATVGGILATSFNAPLRMRYGAVRDLVLDATVVLASGQSLHTGRPVIKNVAGYDLTRLFVGAYGTLGATADATLKVVPQPQVSASLVVAVDDLAQGLEWGRALLPVCLNASCLALCCGGEHGLMGSNGGSAAPYSLIYTVEGLRSEVSAELAEARRVLRAYGAPNPLDWDDQTGSAVWAAWMRSAAPNPAKGSVETPLVRLGVAPKDLPAVIRRQSTHLEGLALWADFSSGLMYVQGSCLHLGAWRAAALKQRGYAVVLAAPDSFPVTGDAVWGYAPECLGLMRQLKARWDPGGLINPGAFLV